MRPEQEALKQAELDATVACAQLCYDARLAFDFGFDGEPSEVVGEGGTWWATAGDSFAAAGWLLPSEACDSLALQIIACGMCPYCGRRMATRRPRGSQRRCWWRRIGRAWEAGCQ